MAGEAAVCHSGPKKEARRSGPPVQRYDGRRAKLLDLDAAAGLFELLLELVGLFLVDAFLDRLWRLVDERLGLLQTEAGRRADDLDDLDLLVAGRGEDDVECRLLLLLGAAGVAATARRRDGRGHCGRGHAELLFERLDALSQLEHGNA